jgi:hypothetical protein
MDGPGFSTDARVATASGARMTVWPMEPCKGNIIGT